MPAGENMSSSNISLAQLFTKIARPLCALAMTVTAAFSAVSYATDFDGDLSDWIIDGPTAGVAWAADATPATFPGGISKGGKSLNYNNGVDYAGSNSGGALSPAISLSGIANPVLRFWSCYNTETRGNQYDRRFVQIYNAAGTVLLAQWQLATVGYSFSPDGSIVGAGPGPSGESYFEGSEFIDAWCQQKIYLDPAWGVVRVRFFFDSVDNQRNGYAGWAIDNMSVESNETPAPTGWPDAIPDNTTSDGDGNELDICSRSGFNLQWAWGTSNLGTPGVHMVIGNHPLSILDGSFLHWSVAHQHIHFSQYSDFSLWQNQPGIGFVKVRKSLKRSFFLVDIDQPRAGAQINRVSPPGSGSSWQAISSGWQDVYGSGTTGQTIDVNGLATGTDYYLVGIVDPLDRLRELDNLNNTDQIHFTLPASSSGVSLIDRSNPYPPTASTLSITGATIGTFNGARAVHVFGSGFDTTLMPSLYDIGTAVSEAPFFTLVSANEMWINIPDVISIPATIDVVRAKGDCSSWRIVTGPYIALSQQAIDDDAAGGTAGNADGVINPGERAGISITLRNHGDVDAHGVIASISVVGSDPAITIAHGALSFPAIGAATNVQGQFLIDIAAGVTTPHAFTLRLDIADAAGRQWQNNLNYTVYTTSQISGTVTLDGAPLSGATIAFTGPQSGTRTTGADGHYILGAIDGLYGIVASANGFISSSTRQVTLPPSVGGVDFAFTSSTISGAVTDSGTGAPIPGVTVSYSGDVSGSVMTDTAGQYSISLVSAKPLSLSLRARKSGFVDSSAVAVNLPPSRALNFALGRPDIVVTPAALGRSVPVGATATQSFQIANPGSVPLTWSLSQPVSGYTYTTSDTGGPAYSWIEISDTGTALPLIGDDQNDGPYQIGFQFPFFGQSFGTFRLCTNGWLSFTSTSTTYSNTNLPSTSAPENMIALFWDDLRFSTGPRIYYKQIDADTLVVEYKNVPFYSNGSVTVTCQAILRSNGSITLQYQALGMAGSPTAGIQDSTRTKGVTVAFNNSVLHDNLAVTIQPVANWLSLSSTSGTVAPGGAENVVATFAPGVLGVGNYATTVMVNSNDLDTPSLSIPVSLSVIDVPVSGTLLEGSFETPYAGPAGVWASFISPTSGSAWTFLGGVISANGSGYTGGNVNAPDGAQVCVLQMGAATSQSLTLAAGSYRLSFQAAQRVNWQASYQVLRVAVDGQVVMDVTPESGMYQLITTPPFSVASGAHTISIAGLNPNGGDNTAFIDDVRISPVSGGNPGDLVAHWTLDEGSGAIAADASGNGNTGTISGTAAWTSGMRGGALSFNGVDDSVSVADAPALRLTGDCSFAFWMYKTSEAADWQRLLGKGAANARNYGLWEEAGAGKRILFQQYDASGGAIVNLYSNTAIEVGAWYHIAGVVSGSTVAIYVNGALDASTTRAGTPVTSADPLTLGYAGFHAKYPGWLDDVRVYSRTLSAAEISALFAPPADDGGLLAHWTLDDGSGQNAADATGHGNTGTIQGGAAWTSGVRGGALSCDGTDDYVSVPDAPSLRLTGDCSFAFWMYKTSEAVDWQRLLGKGAANARNYGLWEEAGAGKRILFQQYDASGAAIVNLYSNTAIEVGAWYHIAGVVSGSTVAIYVNGALDASTTRAGTPATSADPLTLGYAGFHARYPGRLDDVRVYNRGLSAAEVMALLATDVPQLAQLDGGFETPSLGVANYAGSPSGSPWSYAGSAGISSNGSGFTAGNPPAPEGVQVAFIQGVSSVQRSATFAAGTYQVSFSAAQRVNWQQSFQVFRVTVDGVAVGTFQPASSQYQNAATNAFTVGAGSHTIVFEGLNPNGGDNTVFIDAVTVAPVTAAPTAHG
jgi:hypothetical protein